MAALKLYMILMGCTPTGRLTEQHDVFFGIATTPADLVQEMLQSWPEAQGKIHVDAWREVNYVNGYEVKIIQREENDTPDSDVSTILFFLNLGGYRPGEFEEYHYKIIVAAKTKADAIDQGKKTVFFKHNSFKGARAHIDDQYGIDVDDLHVISDILPAATKAKYRIKVIPVKGEEQQDELHIGYFKISRL